MNEQWFYSYKVLENILENIDFITFAPDFSLAPWFDNETSLFGKIAES